MFFPKCVTALLRRSGAVCSCSSITSRHWGCLFVLSVSDLLFDLCSLSLVAYIVLFCCKNNLFEFCFLMHEDRWFCHPSLFCYCFSLCLASYLVGICVAEAEYQTYIMTTDFFSSEAVFELNSCYFLNIFRIPHDANSWFYCVWHPSQCSQSLTFLLSPLYIPCCSTCLSRVCQIFTSFSYETRT